MRSLDKAVDHAGFLENVSEHKHDDQCGCIGNDQDADDHHHDGEDDAFELADLAKALHADDAFFRSGHQAHDGRLDQRNESHVGVGGDCDRAYQVRSELIRREDGRGTVRPADDADGRRFAERKSAERDASEVSLPASGRESNACEPGVEYRHHLHPAQARVRVPDRDYRLVQPPDTRMEALKLAVVGLLRGCASGGRRQVRLAGGVQYRSGFAIHFREVYEVLRGRGLHGEAVYGRQGPFTG